MYFTNGAKLIKIDQSNKEEKALYEGAQKLAGIAIAFGQAFAYTWSGMYGDIRRGGSRKLHFNRLATYLGLHDHNPLG